MPDTETISAVLDRNFSQSNDKGPPKTRQALAGTYLWTAFFFWPRHPQIQKAPTSKFRRTSRGQGTCKTLFSFPHTRRSPPFTHLNLSLLGTKTYCVVQTRIEAASRLKLNSINVDWEPPPPPLPSDNVAATWSQERQASEDGHTPETHTTTRNNASSPEKE